MQFGACFAWIIQQIWEANPADGPVWLFKWDMLDAFHRCNLRPSDVGKFAYGMPPLPEDTSVLLCVDLVLTMGLVNSPNLFCSASKTAADNAKVYTLDLDSTFMVCPPTAGAYNNSDGVTASPNRLQYIDVYIDNLFFASQGDTTQ